MTTDFKDSFGTQDRKEFFANDFAYLKHGKVFYLPFPAVAGLMVLEAAPVALSIEPVRAVLIAYVAVYLIPKFTGKDG